jgi:DNA polymerase-4
MGDIVVHRERLRVKLGDGVDDLARLARGEDDRPVLSDHDAAKSLGQEHTYEADTADLRRLRATLLSLCDAVARRLRQHQLRGRTVTLKYRTEGFETHTRAETLPRGTDSGDTLFDVVWGLFQGIHRGRKVRLLGVYASGLGAPDQLDLFPDETRPADRLRDRVAEKFGARALTRASLLPGAGKDKRGDR